MKTVINNVTAKYLFLLIFCLSSINFAQSFEGKVKFKMSYEDNHYLIDYFMKDENLRMEFGNNKEAVFIKNKDKSIIVMPDQKMYMDLDNSIFDKIKNMTGMNKEDENEKKEEFDINKYKTGKTKTILGYKCYQWIFKDKEDNNEFEAWVTDELGNFMFMQSPMGGGVSPSWSSSLNNKGFFPILVITKDEKGNETSRFEATEISKETLQSSLFKPPADFEEMKMPGF